MGNTKGVTANNYVEYIKARATAEQFEQLIAALDTTDRVMFFEQPILAISLVDYEAVMRLLLTADRIIGANDRQLLRDASRDNQVRNLNGIYKALLPLASPEFIINRASKLWQRYHDTGHVTTERLSPHKVKLTLHDYPDIPEHHGPEIEGAFEGLMVLAKKDLDGTTHTRCVNRGDPECEWEIAWK